MAGRCACACPLWKLTFEIQTNSMQYLSSYGGLPSIYTTVLSSRSWVSIPKSQVELYLRDADA